MNLAQISAAIPEIFDTQTKEIKMKVTDSAKTEPYLHVVFDVVEKKYKKSTNFQSKLAATLRGSRPGVQSASPKTPKNRPPTSF